jgi:hypothetical protein
MARAMSTPVLTARGPHCPQAIGVEQAKLHRPARAARRVAPVERAGQQHVLCSDDDPGLLGVDVPIAFILATHENVYGHFGLEEVDLAEVLYPPGSIVPRLLDEHPHGQTVCEPPRRLTPDVIARPEPPPQPANDNHRRLAEAGGDVGQARQLAGKLRLKSERFFTGGLSKERLESATLLHRHSS